MLNLVVTGRADATPVYEVTINDAAKNLGIAVKAVGGVIASDPTHFALRKDEESQKLAYINKAISKSVAPVLLMELNKDKIPRQFNQIPSAIFAILGLIKAGSIAFMITVMEMFGAAKFLSSLSEAISKYTSP